MKQTLSFLTCLTILTGCTTSEQIRRARIVDDLSVKMVESEKRLSARSAQNEEIAKRVEGLEKVFQKFSGNIEENQHQLALGQQKAIEDLEEKVRLLEDKLENLFKDQKRQGDLLAKKMAGQQRYLDQVLKTLQSLKKKSPAPQKNPRS